MRRAAIIVLLPTMLAACAGAPSLSAVDAGTEGIAYRFRGSGLAEAERQASLYCANLGRSATLLEVARATDGSDLARFDCR
jgi:hypothetical protein